MTGDRITVRGRKYDGSIRRSWIGGLVTQNDSLITLVAEFSETVEHDDLGTIPGGTISVEHFWTDRWFNVFQFRDPDGSKRATYANIAMPATFDGEIIDYIDLDIDVVLWPDGRVQVLDRDDFERNSIEYAYPEDVRRRAEDSLEELLRMIDRREFPFND